MGSSHEWSYQGSKLFHALPQRRAFLDHHVGFLYGVANLFYILYDHVAFYFALSYSIERIPGSSLRASRFIFWQGSLTERIKQVLERGTKLGSIDLYIARNIIADYAHAGISSDCYALRIDNVADGNVVSITHSIGPF